MIGGQAKLAADTAARGPQLDQARPNSTHLKTETLRRKVSLGFQAGDCLRYEFTQKRTVELDLRDLAANASGRPVTSGRVRVEQRGELLVKIYEERPGDDGGWIVGFELQRPFIKMSAPDAQQASASQDFSKVMAGEILAFVERNGRIGKFIALPSMSADALNQWKDILARWQVVLADDPSATRWTRREEDTTGIYLATYVRQPGSPTQIIKTKTTYIEVRTANQSTLNGTSKITGSTVIMLNPHPVRIAGQESVQLASRGLGPNVYSESEFVFQLLHSGFRTDIAQAGPGKAAQWAAAPASLPWSAQPSPSGDAILITPGTGAAVARAHIAGLAELLARGGAESPEEQKFMEKLYDAVKADDGAVEAIMDQLGRPDCSKEMASVLIGVLGAAGTEMAQHSLLSMVADANWPREQREMSVFSFAQVQQPIAGVEAALQALHAEQGPY
ncbi:MAG: hypothetical protein N2689_13005, partial [Verrucomicrobiae bacterium]|nr:hypothetical protein [Verrucomicrobiae bacterium]